MNGLDMAMWLTGIYLRVCLFCAIVKVFAWDRWQAQIADAWPDGWTRLLGVLWPG